MFLLEKVKLRAALASFVVTEEEKNTEDKEELGIAAGMRAASV